MVGATANQYTSFSKRKWCYFTFRICTIFKCCQLNVKQFIFTYNNIKLCNSTACVSHENTIDYGKLNTILTSSLSLSISRAAPPFNV